MTSPCGARRLLAERVGASALIEAEGRDVDERHNVAGAESGFGDDRATVAVPPMHPRDEADRAAHRQSQPREGECLCRSAQMQIVPLFFPALGVGFLTANWLIVVRRMAQGDRASAGWRGAQPAA